MYITHQPFSQSQLESNIDHGNALSHIFSQNLFVLLQYKTMIKREVSMRTKKTKCLGYPTAAETSQPNQSPSLAEGDSL